MLVSRHSHHVAILRHSLTCVLEFQPELRALVAGLEAVSAALLLAHLPQGAAAGAEVKHRLLAALDGRPPQTEPDGIVVTDPAGLVEWVNPAFSAMCGYECAELRGRKPGHVLQGPDTDAATVQRIREAVAARRPCRETLVNDHRNGSRYIVDAAITPILDDEGQPLWFIAREREVQAAA